MCSIHASTDSCQVTSLWQLGALITKINISDYVLNMNKIRYLAPTKMQFNTWLMYNKNNINTLITSVAAC